MKRKAPYFIREFWVRNDKWVERNKKIGNQMKEALKLLEAEEASVALRPITGGGSGDWLSKREVGDHFLAHMAGMYLSEFTLMGKRGNVAYLREHSKEGNLDTSSNYWVFTYLFSTSYKLERILDD